MADPTYHGSGAIRILYEDDDCVALGKPSGLVVHPDGRTEEDSLDRWVLERYPANARIGGVHSLDNGRTIPRFGIVHRLDRETSGVVLVAKHERAFEWLTERFLLRQVEKVYDAIVHGHVAEPDGAIGFPIGRSRSDFRKYATGEDARGTLRPAQTDYHLLAEGALQAHVECRPRTGRTHQIRVHLSAIGHPIVCDRRYGGPCALGLGRLALHARTLALLCHDGVERTFDAPLPGDFREALRALGGGE
jgi:23S rRNA pseudouridine1911/1915/1917 synthase